jgi:hypothetical protein
MNVNIFNPKNDQTIKQLTVWSFLKDKQSNLEYMHLHKLRLKCDCTTPQAISFPKRYQSSYTLVNHAEFGQHKPSCQLFTLVSGEINHSGEAPLVTSPKPPKSFTPIKITVGNTDAKNNQLNSPSNKSTSKNDSIHSLLCYAFSEKRFEYLHCDKSINLNALYYTDTFKVNVTSVNKMPPIQVKDITFILPAENAKNFKRKLLGLQPRFAPHVPLHANFIFMVENADFDSDSSVLTYTNDNKEYKAQCFQVSHHFPNTRGPRIIFLIKAFINECWSTVKIYSHPIISLDRPIMIDSDLERQFCLEVLSLNDERLSLMKYVHHDEYQGVKLLPDFKLTYKCESRHRSVIVEVMGMNNDEEYIERKKRLVPLMEENYKLKVVDVVPGNIKYQTKQLTDKMINIS